MRQDYGNMPLSHSVYYTRTRADNLFLVQGKGSYSEAQMATETAGLLSQDPIHGGMLKNAQRHK